MIGRFARKVKRLERGSARFATDIESPRGRRRAWLYFLFIDHALLRIPWTNLHRVADGVWRSNHPSPRRIRRYRRMGIRTILNLRGAFPSAPYLFEREACAAEGLTLIDIPLQARALCPRETLLELLDLFERIERPFVMHCKSGADRAGLASALYLMHMEGVPVDEARKQLGMRYIHFESFRTGILDHMLHAYERDTADRPMPVRQWIETRYDPVRLSAEFDRKRAER